MNTKKQAEATPAKSGQHTPGPWEVSTEPDESGRYVIQHRETIMWGGVAYVWGKNNARLIAAAPDLLKACKMLSGRVDKIDWVFVEATLAKAERGQQ